MPSTTVNGSGYQINYSIQSGQKVTQVVSTTSNIVLATTVNGTNEDVARQLDNKVSSNNRYIAELKTEIDQDKAIVADPNSSQRQVNSATKRIEDNQSKTEVAQKDIAAANLAKQDVLANSDSTFSALEKGNAPPGDTPASTNTKSTQDEADSASSETAADAVEDEEGTPDPESQDTGTDSSNVGEELTTDEETNLNSDPVDEDALVPGVSSDVTNPLESTIDSPGVSRSVTAGNTSEVQTFGNVLNNFASYTYGLTLHLLTVSGYQKVVNEGVVQYDSASIKTLISSGQRFKGIRDAAFKDDFYFDTLKMKTVIAPNNINKSSNAIDLSFVIVEPYGMTLMDRLLDVNTYELGAKNYLDMPYLLEINFYGYDDAGHPADLSALTKYIPIKLLSMKIRASVKGSEYTIQAVPFSQQANFYSTQATPANFEITAATIDDFFKNTTDSGTSKTVSDAVSQTTADSSRSESAAQKPNDATAAKEAKNPDTASPSDEVMYDEMGNVIGTRTVSNDSAATGGSSAAAAPTKSKPGVKVASYTAAYNAWYKKVKENGRTKTADTIEFVIADDIKNAKLIVDKKVDPATTSTANKNAASKGNSSAIQNKTAVSGPDMTSRVFRVNAGDNILSVIDSVISTSSFIRDQIVDVESESTRATAASSGESLSSARGLDKPTFWYKIVPKVELKEFDNVKNQWGKHITFYIKKYRYYNSKDPRMDKTKLPNPVKEYDYIYTGHNRDVIEFDMNFDSMYYTSVQVSTHQLEALSKGQNADESKLKAKSQGEASGSQTPQKKGVQPGNAPGSNKGASSTSETQNAANVKESIYSNAAADQLSINLKIVGDPEFIKQDDVFVNPGVTGLDSTDQHIEEGNSLTMDSGEIFCKLSFKSPVDIDENTGLLRKGKYHESNFSGLYKVLVVDSEFRGGKFLQTLQMIRQPNQPGDGRNTKPENSSIDNRLGDKGLNSQMDNSQISGDSIPDNSPDVVQEDIQGEDTSDDRDTSSIDEDTPEDTSFEDVETDPASTSPYEDEELVDEDQAELADVADTGETVDIGDNQTDTGEDIVQGGDVPASERLSTQQTGVQQIQTIKNENDQLLAESQGIKAKSAEITKQINDLDNKILARDPVNGVGTPEEEATSKALNSQRNAYQQQIQTNVNKMQANASKAVSIGAATRNNVSVTYDNRSTNGLGIGYNVPTIKGG